MLFPAAPPFSGQGLLTLHLFCGGVQPLRCDIVVQDIAAEVRIKPGEPFLIGYSPGVLPFTDKLCLFLNALPQGGGIVYLVIQRWCFLLYRSMPLFCLGGFWWEG